MKADLVDDDQGQAADLLELLGEAPGPLGAPDVHVDRVVAD